LIRGDRVIGAVLDIDRFGNVITNIRAADLTPRVVIRIAVGGATIEGLSNAYDPTRALVAVEDSDGWIEVAAPGGSAAARLRINVDDPVEIHLASPS
jgi:S-adenosylmethionine hydrolase